MNSLPDGWVYSTIGATGQYLNGLGFSQTDWEPHGLPIIRIQNLTDPDKPFNYTSKPVESAYFVETGDILVSWSATLDAFIWRGPKGLLNQHIFKVTPNTDVVDKQFLFYLLRHSIQQLMDSEHLHGSTMKHINRGPFLAHRIKLPPMHQQLQIVEELDKQFSRLDDAEQGLAKVQSLLSQANLSTTEALIRGLWPSRAPVVSANGSNTDELLIQDQDWLCPTGWRLLPVADLATIVEYGTSAKTNEDASGIPVLRMGNIQDGQLSIEKLKFLPKEHTEFPRLILKKGDILFNRTNSRELVGKTAVFDLDGEYSYASYLIRLRLNEDCNPHFLAACLNSPSAKKWIDRVAVQQTGQANVNGSKLKALVVPVPPRDVQDRVCAEYLLSCQTLFRTQGEIDLALVRIRNLRQALLSAAFSGRLSGPRQVSALVTSELRVEGSADPSVSEPHTPSEASQTTAMKKPTKMIDSAESLAQAVREQDGPIRPSDLYRAIEQTDDAIDRFYEYLREAQRLGLVDVPRASAEEVLITAK